MTLQISEADLAKVRLKCLELAATGDASTTLKRAAIYAAWCVRDRTDRSERTPPPAEAPPPPLAERLAGFKLGKVAAIAASGKPGALDRIKRTLGLSNPEKTK